MCGIVGYIGHQPAEEILLSGLKRLEYRGYDSAGIAVGVSNGKDVQVTRALGKLSALVEKVSLKDENQNPEAKRLQVGIGHTRWATHGRPTENNAHPHRAGRITLIHNGIIENYSELRERLEGEGAKFQSETDTEIAAHLIDSHLKSGQDTLSALIKACAEMRGSYAFLVLDSQNLEKIYIAKNATPIVVGVGKEEMVLASDIPAILDISRDMIVLEDGDFATLSTSGIEIVDANQKPVTRPTERITWDPITAQKSGYEHYMLKEIHEQPRVVVDTFRGRVRRGAHRVDLSELGLDPERLRGIRRIQFAACGSAWHAALVAKFFVEKFARIPCDVDYASEFRYRDRLLSDDTLVVAVSQSGETADTLAVLTDAAKFSPTLSICNVLGSSIARRSDAVLYTHAGPEISVASTKAFVTQLVAAYLFAVHLGQELGTLSSEASLELVQQLEHFPSVLQESMNCEETVRSVAGDYSHARDFFFIARGACYPIALEGALKLKEISYIHAEGYPAGELKHGPLALVDEKVPVVVLLQRSETLFEKTFSNLKEVESRGGRIITITDHEESREIQSVSERVIQVPHISEFLSPILFTVPLQFLAYYIAVNNGCDVDLPRNLAKSVTVE